ALVAARALARFDDPDVPRRDAGLPARVDLADVLGETVLDGAALAGQWSSRAAAASPAATIGLTSDGPVEIDLVAHGPHALGAGTTGAGKSELLRTLVASLAIRSSPRDLNVVLIDYKGGSAFDACAALPHVVGVVTDLDDALAARALRSLHAELRRRERVLRT